MGNVKYTKTEPWHIRYVADNMREEDVNELHAGMKYDTYETLKNAVDISLYAVTAVDDDGFPFAVFGVAPWENDKDKGSPWMLATPDLMNYKRNLLADGLKVIQLMLNHYPKLENYIHSENKRSIKWLRFLGFKIGDVVTYPTGEKFLTFSMGG